LRQLFPKLQVNGDAVDQVLALLAALVEESLLKTEVFAREVSHPIEQFAKRICRTAFRGKPIDLTRGPGEELRVILIFLYPARGAEIGRHNGSPLCCRPPRIFVFYL
jgi:hypothetical protein